jgi:phage tail-like protein
MKLHLAFLPCFMFVVWPLPTSAAEVSRHQPIDGVAEAVRFSLVVDQVEIASFSEAVEISLISDPPRLSSPANAVDPKSLPRKRSGSDRGLVILRRKHESQQTHLWEWVQNTIATGKPIEKAFVILHNSKGEAVARYHLQSAWPSKVEIGALKAGASEVLMETVTMTCESIERVSA